MSLRPSRATLDTSAPCNHASLTDVFLLGLTSSKGKAVLQILQLVLACSAAQRINSNMLVILANLTSGRGKWKLP